MTKPLPIGTKVLVSEDAQYMRYIDDTLKASNPKITGKEGYIVSTSEKGDNLVYGVGTSVGSPVGFLVGRDYLTPVQTPEEQLHRLNEVRDILEAVGLHDNKYFDLIEDDLDSLELHVAHNEDVKKAEKLHALLKSGLEWDVLPCHVQERYIDAARSVTFKE